MTSLGSAIDEALKRANGAEQATVSIERIRAVLAYIGKRAAAADPLLTSVPTLEGIANGFVGVRNELQNYAANGNVAHLTNASVPTDNALSSAATLPVTESPEELGQLISASISYREQIEQASTSARTAYQEAVADASAFQKQIDAVKSSLDAEVQKVNRLGSDYQSQFSTSQESRNNEFASVMRTAQQDILRLQNEYQVQFTAGQEKRTQESSDLLEDQRTKFAAQAENLKQLTADITSNTRADLAALERSFKESAEDAIREIAEKQRHVEKLVGVIGNLGVTSGYLRAANSAKWAMWLWQFLTVSSLVTLTVLAYKTLHVIEDNKGAMNWIGFAGRVLLLVSVGAIAGYSAFQADKLFADEKRNRKLALELEAIGPYLAPLPLEDQNKFRLQIGSRSFGRDIESVIHKHKRSPVSVVELLKSKEGKEILEVVVDAVKKAK